MLPSARNPTPAVRASIPILPLRARRALNAGEPAFAGFETTKNARMFLPIESGVAIYSGVESFEQRFVSVKPPQVEAENHDVGRRSRGEPLHELVQIAQVLDHAAGVEEVVAAHPEHFSTEFHDARGAKHKYFGTLCIKLEEFVAVKALIENAAHEKGSWIRTLSCDDALDGPGFAGAPEDDFDHENQEEQRQKEEKDFEREAARTATPVVGDAGAGLANGGLLWQGVRHCYDHFWAKPARNVLRASGQSIEVPTTGSIRLALVLPCRNCKESCLLVQ
jgi:hypothetical protein